MSGFLEFCLLIRSNSFLDCNLFGDNNFNATYSTVELSQERKHPCLQAFEKRICTTSDIKQYTLYKCKSSQLSHKTLFESLMHAAITYQNLGVHSRIEAWSKSMPFAHIFIELKMILNMRTRMPRSSVTVSGELSAFTTYGPQLIFL